MHDLNDKEFDLNIDNIIFDMFNIEIFRINKFSFEFGKLRRSAMDGGSYDGVTVLHFWG